MPKGFFPGVEKGVREAAAEGVLAGYPLVDFKATLYDGSFHTVDSNELSFKIAASMALKKGVMECKPALLEPIMSVTVTVPEQYMGDVNRDLNSRRGRVLGMDPAGDGTQVVTAHVPQAELFSYATELRSLTHGRGTFKAELDHYEEVPSHVAEKVDRPASQGGRSRPLRAIIRVRREGLQGEPQVEPALVERPADDGTGAADPSGRQDVVDRADPARRDDPAPA